MAKVGGKLVPAVFIRSPPLSFDPLADMISPRLETPSFASGLEGYFCTAVVFSRLNEVMLSAEGS